MSNYIRACFCTNSDVNEKIFSSITNSFLTMDCVMAGDLNITENCFRQELNLAFETEEFNSRLLSIGDRKKNNFVSFDIDSNIFLLDKIAYFPNNEVKFHKYKLLLLKIVEILTPSFGIIDYEADLICSEVQNSIKFNWGYFISYKSFNFVDELDIKEVFSLLDEYNIIKNIGILAFKHPLGVSEITNDERKFIWKIRKKYSGF